MMIADRSARRIAASSLVTAAALCAGLLSAAVPRAACGQTPGGPGPTPDTSPARLSGKITRETQGVSGARVLAYRTFADLLVFRSAAVSAPSGEDGSYLLSLPAGTYHLVARGQDDPLAGPLAVGGLFSIHGSNPFALGPGSEHVVNFSLARKISEAILKPSVDPGSGTLGGVVTREGQALAGVQVNLYLDPQSAFRGRGYAMIPSTDEHGAFSFDSLPDGAYFVVARKRAAGVRPGPLAEGDFYGWYADNPVLVRGGTAVGIALELIVKGREVGNADGRTPASGTRIAGRITDATGAVVRGVYAFAYEEKVMAGKMPAFISKEVDDQGRYVIYLSRAGTFYVGAREAYGDIPGMGEWYGRYVGSADHGVVVGEGAAVEGIDIRVERILQ